MPDNLVFARLQLGKRKSQQGGIRLIYLHVTLIDRQTGGIKYRILLKAGSNFSVNQIFT